MVAVYFYAPSKKAQKNIQQPQDQWTGIHSNFTAWIAQTYFHLKRAGFPCEIATKIPDEGILVAEQESVEKYYPLLDNVMLVYTRSDQDYHPSAHLHIVHNRLSWEKTRNSLWNPHFIEHWPMPGIIPRDRTRETLVENISYIGTRSQLAPELKSQSWTDALEDLNCRWKPIWETHQWNDYNDLDVIVAARSFDARSYPLKGPIKLLNAWQAGVPAILTPESGFMAERKTDLDFIIVRSLQEAIAAIRYLQDNPDLYQKMSINALERAQDYTVERVLKQWLDFFNDVAFPAYLEWTSMSHASRKQIFRKRFLYFKTLRVGDKISRLISKR
ncbi:MAG: hypothetical protein N5P05_002848 [Chroococcopsis gigantea SAG 12.99]|jgi:hypothetical protein|nr:glycosyltransferase family 1 protein [Chlorogloea purpurea SAG 13.99]MDV3001242.1 hypothetical protein [Chroococcopsis gigantea SAG 12.99]